MSSKISLWGCSLNVYVIIIVIVVTIINYHLNQHNHQAQLGEPPSEKEYSQYWSISVVCDGNGHVWHFLGIE